MGLIRNSVCVLAVLFIGSRLCFAQEGPLAGKLKELEARIEGLEERLRGQERLIKEQNQCIEKQTEEISQYRSKFEHIDTHLLHREKVPALAEEGFSIGAGATFVFQGTHNANATEKRKDDVFDAAYSADIEIEKEFEGLKGKAFLHLETGEGAGVEDELVLYSSVNSDANDDNNVRLSEFWYEQKMFGEDILLTFGKLGPTSYFDNNLVANDETTQFLAGIFRNNPVIEFPDNSAGLRFSFIPYRWLEFGYGVFDADSDWEDAGDNLFNIAQVNFKPGLFGLEGNYRILGWHNDSYHTKWSDAGKNKEDNYGFALSFDQKVMEAVSLFTRYGWQNPRVYNPNLTASDGSNFSLAYSWSVGLQLEGSLWDRENDRLSFALGQAIPSNDYKNAGVSRNAENEGHFEAFYNFYISDNFSVTPDFQYIWNPYGKDVLDREDSISIFGLRTQVDF